ncbi:MAG: hypothetical protein U1A27_03800 [Phycisphaerae bacterium]
MKPRPTPMRIAATLTGLWATVASAALVNFDQYPDGSPVVSGYLTTQWSTVGVEFSDGQGFGPQPSMNACSYSAPNHAYAARIIATFVDPCTGIPSVTDSAGTRQDLCWVPGEGIDMFWYDASGGLLHHEFNAGGGNLLTFSTPQPIIARLEMVCVLQGIDDFVFSTPQPVLRGDMNCDTAVNAGDVEPFVLALVAPDEYGALFPACDIRRADMNCDRKVNGADAQGFVTALIGP